MSLTLNATSVNDVLSAVRRDAEEVRKREGVAFAWAGILRRVVHLITRSTKHDVSLDRDGWQPAPAWTDGTNIHLSGRILDPNHRWGTDDPAELVVRLKGAVYHELAHILYSPRVGSPLRNAVLAERLHDVWNILEDGRIESIFSRRFPRAASYFKLLVVRWLLENGVDHDDEEHDAFTPLLVVGRRHLPRRLRDDAYRRLTVVAGQAKADELVAQVSIFHSTPVEDWEGQLECVRVVSRILRDLHQNHAPEPPVGDGHGGQREGTPQEGADDPGDDGDWSFDPSDEEDAVTDGYGDTGDDDAEDTIPNGDGDPSDEDGTPTDEDGEDGSGAADGNDTPEGDVSADGGGGDSDGGTDGADADADADATSGSGASQTGNQTGGVSDHTSDDVQPIDWEAELAQAEAEVSEDISQTIEAVRAEAEQTGGGSGNGVEHRDTPVSADTRLVQVRIKEALAQLRNDTAPEPQPRQRAGRLDTRRFLDPHRLPHELDTFRNQTTGEGFNSELVILLDVSGSMDHRISEAAQALWALATAADAEGIPTSVVTFASEGHWSLWKGPNDRWDNGTVLVPLAGGGTDPAQPLLWAVDYLTASPHDRKLLVTITDGLWAGAERDYRSIYAEADKHGVQSLCIGIGGCDVVTPQYAGFTDGGHGAGATANAASILAVPALVQGWVDTIVRS